MPVDAAAGGALIGKSIEAAKTFGRDGLQQLPLVQRGGNPEEDW